MHKPVDQLTWRAEDGAALLARVQLSHGPRADAETVAWVLRMGFEVVCALHEAPRSAQRLRSWRCGKSPEPSPAAAAAARPADGGGPRTAAALKAAAAGAVATAPPAPPRELPPPEQAQRKGGHRPGTGRLEAAASAGATRVAGRPAPRAVGPRGPVGGQGTLSQGPAGGERRLDGHALRRALPYAWAKRRGGR